MKRGLIMDNPIAAAFTDRAKCLESIHEARELFGNKSTTESQYTQMEKALALGYLYCPDDLKGTFERTLLEATKRRFWYEELIWK